MYSFFLSFFLSSSSFSSSSSSPPAPAPPPPSSSCPFGAMRARACAPEEGEKSVCGLSKLHLASDREGWGGGGGSHKMSLFYFDPLDKNLFREGNSCFKP